MASISNDDKKGLLIKNIRKNTATNIVAPFLPKIIFLMYKCCNLDIRCNFECCTILHLQANLY
ncbi:hypothetical protein BpHYR1_010257 [Brachionus plicatilis]|uniref:Uncharacterized protein n=1 Tax=Brachionus plicatilis TaxID=10195 RepID=A0A3M7R517_BRAPC|nr:hypothetical protein BpHYR1_010257 [Brachionus plicatilis]